MIHYVQVRSAFDVMLRVHVRGEIATIADVDSITFEVFASTGGVALTTGTLTVADVMFDTLQLNGMWNRDAIGYNFLHENNDSVLTTVGSYYIEYRFTSGATVFNAPRTVINASDTVVVQEGMWASGEDLVAYYDAQTVGQMLKDDRTSVAVADVPTHPVVLRMLSAASGEVDSALNHARRYTSDELATLTGASKEHLTNITCAVAMWLLSERRLPGNPDKQKAAREIAQSHLERLRKGTTVLNLEPQKTAGLAAGMRFVSTDPVEQDRNRYTGITGPFPRSNP